jgi:hypothetical protein
VGVEGGVGAAGLEAGAPPPPPPQPNSGAVMLTPSAINTSRRLVLTGAAEAETSTGASFALIDWFPSIISFRFLVDRILSKARNLFPHAH